MDKNVIKIIDKGHDGYLLLVDKKEISFRTFADAETFIKKLSQETKQDYIWEYDSDYVAEKSIAPTSIRSVQQLTPLMVADQNLSGLSGKNSRRRMRGLSDDDGDMTDEEIIEMVKDWVMNLAYKCGKLYINDSYSDTNIVEVANMLAEYSEIIGRPEIEIKEKLVEGGLDEIARIENIEL